MGEGERSGADRNNAYPSPRTHIHRPERISVTPNAYLSSRAQRGICFIAGEGSSLAALGMTGTPKHEPVADAKHRLLGHNLKAAAPVETHVPGPVCFQITNALVLVEQLARSEEHTSELQSLMRSSYAVFCLKKQKKNKEQYTQTYKQ